MNPRPDQASSRIPTPLPDCCADARLRLFFGGSFDPPHTGHAILPQRVRETLREPDAHLVYVPAARSPHKHELPTQDRHRLAMLALCIAPIPDATIWSEELDRSATANPQPSYWVDTWSTVNAMALPGENRFLIGADQALSMHRWHRYTEFWRDAIVMLRDDLDDRDRFIVAMQGLGAWSATDLDHWLHRTVLTPTIDASSTEIRAALRDPMRRENPIAGLNDRVHRYILEHQLYTPA